MTADVHESQAPITPYQAWTEAGRFLCKHFGHQPTMTMAGTGTEGRGPWYEWTCVRCKVKRLYTAAAMREFPIFPRGSEIAL